MNEELHVLVELAMERGQIEELGEWVRFSMLTVTNYKTHVTVQQVNG